MSTTTTTTSHNKTEKLSKDNINPNVVNAVFVVRGKVQEEAEKLEQELKKPDHKLPFDQLIYCNIGNPQAQSQKPITFLRHVLSIMDSPDLFKHREQLIQCGAFHREEFDRAEQMLRSMNAFPSDDDDDKKKKNISSTGAYTQAQGIPFVRENVCKFIEKRDKLSSGTINPSRIFMTDGAGAAVKYILQMLIRPNTSDAIMIPLPQYPLYSAGITLYGGNQVGYYLNEEEKWGLSLTELERVYDQEVQKGTKIRALVVINPGNPTGSCLSKDNIAQIIQFCIQRGIVLLADEVYQDNIYDHSEHSEPAVQFYSFNRAMYELGVQDDLELISFHSASKGYLGECGRRGGYFHLGQSISNDIVAELNKLVSVILAPNTHGQLAMDILVNPPTSGESAKQYKQERDAIMNSLKRRAKLVSETFNTLPGVSCQPIDGAMYAFPKITIPEKAVKVAQEQGLAPDLWYVLEMLKHTGVVSVAGSGFGQKSGTYHFRTTFLPQEHEIQKALEGFKKFQTKFMEEYA